MHDSSYLVYLIYRSHTVSCLTVVSIPLHLPDVISSSVALIFQQLCHEFNEKVAAQLTLNNAAASGGGELTGSLKTALRLLNQQLIIYANHSIPIPTLDDRPLLRYNASRKSLSLESCRDQSLASSLLGGVPSSSSSNSLFEKLFSS